MAHRLIIFDADDTLRRTLVPSQPCLRAPREWALIPAVADQLHALRWGNGGLKVGVASNQDQVAYGHLSEQMARALLTDMISAATDHVPPPAAVQLCTHALEYPFSWGKPEPGMLLRIMSHYNVPAHETLFVGNAPTDQEAARRAGAPFAFAQDFFRSSREQS
ncbi:MAG: HAD-IIIA family hydrolase [Gemmatimonadaceae bacterium]